MSSPAQTTAYGWKTPTLTLMLLTGAMHFSFAIWMALLNNFAIEKAAFSGADIGILQSLREVPGFLAFTAIFLLFLMREQTLALGSLVTFGVGVALTGYFPSFGGLIATTMIMSIGFHYYETMAQSLALQWLPRATAPALMGRIVSAGSFGAIIGYGLVYAGWKLAGLEFSSIYLAGGLVTAVIAAVLWLTFPHFREDVPQRKTLFLRKRYWLYYALVFMSGTRRQIFVVFAGFLLVQKFGYSVPTVAALYLVNQIINTLLAPQIGRLISRFGERRALILEYAGLIVVFTSYGMVEQGWLAGGLYIIDHIFFAMAIAMKTYFQKIADPADIAPTAGVAFTISHIAAIFVPALFGMIWLWSPAAVFMIGAAMAFVSLLLALQVPHDPAPGNETLAGGTFQRGLAMPR